MNICKLRYFLAEAQKYIEMVREELKEEGNNGRNEMREMQRINDKNGGNQG